MGILSWIAVGLVAGLLAKLLMPGDQGGGFIITVVLGVAGALVGGWIMSLIGQTGITGFDLWTVLVATLGALVVLFVYRLVKK